MSSEFAVEIRAGRRQQEISKDRQVEDAEQKRKGMKVEESREQREEAETRKYNSEGASPTLAKKKTDAENNDDRGVDQERHGQKVAETGEETLSCVALRSHRSQAGGHATHKADAQGQDNQKRGTNKLEISRKGDAKRSHGASAKSER